MTPVLTERNALGKTRTAPGPAAQRGRLGQYAKVRAQAPASYPDQLEPAASRTRTEQGPDRATPRRAAPHHRSEIPGQCARSPLHAPEVRPAAGGANISPPHTQVLAAGAVAATGERPESVPASCYADSVPPARIGVPPIRPEQGRLPPVESGPRPASGPAPGTAAATRPGPRGAAQSSQPERSK